MNKNHIEFILKSDFKDIENWHEQNQYEELDLSGAFFSGKDFSKFDFSRSILDHSTFIDCNLDETVFNSVKFRNTTLENVSAKKAILHRFLLYSL